MHLREAAEITRAYRAEDVADFRAVAGMPSAETGAQVVPEPLIAALFSYLLGVRLPGKGTNYLKQDLVFHAAPEVGTDLTARVEITGLRPEKHLVDLRTTCHDGAGRLVCEGRALVLVRDLGA